jgi:hypothetical protein
MLEDVMVISRYPSASFDTILSNLFWNVHLLHPGGERRDLPWSLVMSLSRLAARTVLFLPVKTYQQIFQKQSIFQTLFNIINTALVASCQYIFTGMCLFCF